MNLTKQAKTTTKKLKLFNILAQQKAMFDFHLFFKTQDKVIRVATFQNLEQYYESYCKLRCHLYQSAYQMHNFHFIGRHKNITRDNRSKNKEIISRCLLKKKKVYCHIHRGTKKHDVHTGVLRKGIRVERYICLCSFWPFMNIIIPRDMLWSNSLSRLP